MKKMLLATTLILVPGATLAEEQSTPAKPTYNYQRHTEHPIYLRVDILAGKFHKANMEGNKYKHRKYALGADFGLGYHLAHNLRTELIYNHTIDPLFKYTSPDGKTNLKSSVRMRTVMARVMFDLFHTGPASIYVGGGVGGARVTQKRNGTLSSAEVIQKSPSKNNLAYSLHAGIAYDVAEGVTADFSWSLRDYGKTRNLVNKTNGVDISNTKLKLRSQNLSMGLRFEV